MALEGLVNDLVRLSRVSGNSGISEDDVLCAYQRRTGLGWSEAVTVLQEDLDDVRFTPTTLPPPPPSPPREATFHPAPEVCQYVTQSTPLRFIEPPLPVDTEPAHPLWVPHEGSMSAEHSRAEREKASAAKRLHGTDCIAVLPDGATHPLTTFLPISREVAQVDCKLSPVVSSCPVYNLSEVEDKKDLKKGLHDSLISEMFAKAAK